MFGGMNGRAAFGAAGYRAVKTVLKWELRRSCNYGGGEAEGLLHGLADFYLFILFLMSL